MNFIDTHTHIYLHDFDNDRDDAVKRAIDRGMKWMLMPNIDAHSIKMMKETEAKYSSVSRSMIGLHPTSVKEDYLKQLDVIEKEAAQNNYIAVGEIGIDLYWDKTFFNEQVIALRSQINLALQLNLPVVIHSRNSFPEVFSVLDEYRGKGLRGVLHAFTGTTDDAKRASDMGFMIGIGGIITFKNSHLVSVIKENGLNNVILETDSPYLAPSPYRGKRNESSYICIILEKLSEILEMTQEDVAKVTYNNSVKRFNLQS